MSEPLQISVHVEEKRYQPTQEKTVVPDWDAKTVTPDKGYALNKVIVEGMPEPTESETFTENGTYDVGRIGTAVVDVDIDLQDKTVTPTEQTQTVEADAGYDGLDTVTVNPIPPEYVVPSGSVDITKNGPVNVAGKETANVAIPVGVFPEGTKVITQNVTGEDVTNFAAVDVAVPGPTGTKQISITQNGTTTEDVSEYAEAEIVVNTLPMKGLVFEDYDSDGYPHSARFVGTWTEIPDSYCYCANNNTFLKKVSSLTIPNSVTVIKNYGLYGLSVTECIMPHTNIRLEYACMKSLLNLNQLVFFGDVNIANIECFRACVKMKSIVFGGNVSAITSGTLMACNSLLLADFSHCTAIPPLYAKTSFEHASGCVIRIPAALSDTTLGTGNGWESATNWSALTNIVWEVV